MAEKRGTLALYVRVSKVAGREDRGDRYRSPKDQIKDATARAERAGYDVRIFDADSKGQGVSGATPYDERPGMAEALKLIESGKLAGLIVSAQDRLVRPERKYGDMLREFQERIRAAGAVLLIADAPNAEVLDPEKELPTGYEALPTDVRGLVDRAVREEATKKWAAARQAAVERGVHICRVAPTGYRKNEAKPKVSGDDRKELTDERRWADPVEGQLVPGDRATVAALRRIFELRARKPRASWTECCKVLEDSGVTNASGEPFWTRGALRHIVSNPVYRGEAYHGADIRRPMAHEPLVDEVTWKRAQADGPGKQTRGSEGSLLGGILRCSCCGRKLTPSITDGRYRCRHRIIAGPACTAPASVQASAIEPYVVRAFIDAIAYRPAAPTPTDLEPYEQTMAAAKAAYHNVLDADFSDIDPIAFKEKLAAAKQKVEQAEAALFEARESAGLDDQRLTLLDRWAEMTVAERRRALQSFDVVAYVERGRQPVGRRVTIEMRADPIADGWQPDVKYTWPSIEPGRIAAWQAKYTDAKYVIKPAILSEEDEAAADATFGSSS